MKTTLITASDLLAALGREEWVICDCRFDLSDPDAGERAYREGHIPGARYVHLERDLSAEPVTDRGRHPMPAPERMAEVFSGLGIDGSRQVVVYDAGPGSYAARLWWMLRYTGHEAVALLDGGFARWVMGGMPVVADSPSPARGRYPLEAIRSDRLVALEEVAASARLIDSRDAARYRGELEPLDPAAGHIPGARNRPFMHNLGPDGCFRPAPELARELESVLDGVPATEAVFYCGSGVTACKTCSRSRTPGSAMGGCMPDRGANGAVIRAGR